MFLSKQSASDVTEYAPIAKALDAEMKVKHLCQDKTGTCQVKSNDVLKLCQSNMKSLSGALLQAPSCDKDNIT